jgi:hypothetical protein
MIKELQLKKNDSNNIEKMKFYSKLVVATRFCKFEDRYKSADVKHSTIILVVIKAM